MLKQYFRLTKPGIIRGNAMTALAGLLLAADSHIHFKVLVSAIVGLSLVIAAGCVANNIIDRDIDGKMARTKNRATVTELISTRQATLFYSTLLAIGVTILVIGTNMLATITAIFGFIMYVVVYGYFKRKSVYGTEVGSVAGAVPPVVGYCAITNSLDTAALLLFLLLVFWQMPHFYSIGIRRRAEYKAAGIPILPVIRGVRVTKIRAVLYTIAFTCTVPLLTVFGYTGYSYLVVVSLMSLIWVFRGIAGFKTANDKKWAGEMFGFSLLLLTTLSVMLCLNAWLP